MTNSVLLNFLPKYTLNLPSDDCIFSFRPFTVGEEKKLMLTKSSMDKKQILLCIKEMIQNCFNISDISDYLISDVEYMILYLRAKSAGETEPFKIKCPYTEETSHFTISLMDNVVVEKNKSKNLIKLNTNTLIKLDYPKFKHLLQTPDYDEDLDKSYKFIASCIVEIQENKIKKQLSTEDTIKYLKKLKNKELEKIINFFDNTTSLFIVGKYLTESKEIKTVKIKGLLNIVNLFYDYINPLSYYKLAFQMKYYHNFSLEEIENLIPWERQIYVEQIKKHLEEKEKNK